MSGVGPSRAISETPQERQMQEKQLPEETAAPLFAPDTTTDFQRRWDAIQAGFVDDPRRAVEQADALVSETMQRLADSFTEERKRLEQQLNLSTPTQQADGYTDREGHRNVLDRDQPAANAETSRTSTEDLRIALRHYRAFFKRLLSV
jgi:hypothetical protein